LDHHDVAADDTVGAALEISLAPGRDRGRHPEEVTRTAREVRKNPTVSTATIAHSSPNVTQ
jgi:hypothetical protein